MLTRTWPNINDPIGGANGVFIVLNDHHCVTQITKSNQRFDETMIIALVQANTRLVQYVQRSHKSGTYLASQPNALCFSARQCCCCARQREVVEPYG